MLLTRREWVQRYGGQELLDSEGLVVILCVGCGDSICHGWKVIKRDLALLPSINLFMPAASESYKKRLAWTLAGQIESMMPCDVCGCEKHNEKGKLICGHKG